MSSILASVLAIALMWAVGGVIILIVGRLKLGLTVENYGSAFIASAAISIVAGIIHWLLHTIGITINPNLLGAILNLIIAAIILLVADRFVKGMKVNGFGGALIAAIAYGVVAGLIHWFLNLFI
jgi:putative membrane protein